MAINIKHKVERDEAGGKKPITKFRFGLWYDRRGTRYLFLRGVSGRLSSLSLKKKKKKPESKPRDDVRRHTSHGVCIHITRAVFYHKRITPRRGR